MRRKGCYWCHKECVGRWCSDVCKNKEKPLKRARMKRYWANIRATKDTDQNSKKQWERKRNADKKCQQKRDANLGVILKKSIVSCRRSDKETNLDVEFLSALFVEQKGKCALTRVKMEFLSGMGRRANPFKISLDKIVPEIGYKKGNVRFVCLWVNNARWFLPDEQFIAWCRLVTLRHPSAKEGGVAE